MISYDDRINKKIDLSYDILKYIMTYKKIEKSDIGMYLVTLTAFIDYYGPTFANTIINSYIDTNIIKSRTIKRITKSKLEEKDDGLFTKEFELDIINNKIFATEIQTNIELLKKKSKLEELNNFIHEMYHLIKSYNNMIQYENDFTTVRLRTGIMEKRIDIFLNKLITNRYTEESINQLQTEDFMNKIFSYSNADIKNKYAREYLNRIKKEIPSYKAPLSYFGTRNILSNLYYDKKFQREYESCSIKGNIKDIYDNFDYYVGDGSFNELSKSIDCYYESKLQDEQAMNKAIKLVVKYKHSTRK